MNYSQWKFEVGNSKWKFEFDLKEPAMRYTGIRCMISSGHNLCDLNAHIEEEGLSQTKICVLCKLGGREGERVSMNSKTETLAEVRARTDVETKQLFGRRAVFVGRRLSQQRMAREMLNWLRLQCKRAFRRAISITAFLCCLIMQGEER